MPWYGRVILIVDDRQLYYTPEDEGRASIEKEKEVEVCGAGAFPHGSTAYARKECGDEQEGSNAPPDFPTLFSFLSIVVSCDSFVDICHGLSLFIVAKLGQKVETCFICY
jgi:hypothetical protein